MRRRRKNPHVDSYYREALELAIIYGSPSWLTNALIYYKQGSECKDCDEEYWNCECEKCDECGFNRCLCDLVDYNNPEDVRKIAWKIAKNTINDEMILHFYNNLIHSFLNYKNTSILESSFIKKLIKFNKKINSENIRKIK